MEEYWQGKRSLAKTFWLLWIAGSLAVSSVAAAFVYAFAFISFPIFMLPSASLAFLTFLLLILFNPYYIVCWVATWRATRNTSNQATAVSVKFLVLIHMAYVAYSLISISNVTVHSRPLFYSQ